MSTTSGKDTARPNHALALAFIPNGHERFASTERSSAKPQPEHFIYSGARPSASEVSHDRPVPASGQRAPPSPRSVRSAPSSPSGRTLPGGIAPLSVISPMPLLSGLPDSPANAGLSSQGHGGPSRTGAGVGMNGFNRPGVIAGPSRAATVPLGAGHVLHPSHGELGLAQINGKSMPRSSQLPLLSTSATLNGHLGGAASRAPSQPLRHPHPSQPAHGMPDGWSLVSRTLAVKHRSRSRPSVRSSTSSGSETETGIESDTTVRPGRLKTQSLSQPDLVALRDRLEGWAGDVAAQHAQGVKGVTNTDEQVRWVAGAPQAGITAQRPQLEKRRSSYGRKTPPARPGLPLQHTTPNPQSHHTVNGSSVPSRSPGSRSYPSLTAMRATSPRAEMLQPLTPAAPGLTFSPPDSLRYRPVGGMTSSEDADDDLSTDSPSSGSLSFSPKRKEIRRRLPFKERTSDTAATATTRPNLSGGLGLVFGDVGSGNAEIPIKEQARLDAEGNLFSLRLLAVFPAVWGYLVLMQAVLTGGIWVNLYPWGIDTSREALDRVITGWGFEGVWAPKHRGDMLLATAWAVLTGHYCFDMTTGLTHRWRVYYDLPATITRLLSIQCICWPLTGLTLWVLGPERILFAWVTIGCTTAASRSVQMYVTSNIPSALPGPTTANGAVAGDITPRRESSLLPGQGASEGRTSLASVQPASSDAVPDGKTWLDDFQVNRHWNWDAVAREVGYKLGVLLLLTNAWLFWGIETGRFAS